MKKRIVIQLDSEADIREQIIIEWLNKQPKDLRGIRTKEGLIDLIASAIMLKPPSSSKINQDAGLINNSQPFFSEAVTIKDDKAPPLVADKKDAPDDAFKEAMKKLTF